MFSDASRRIKVNYFTFCSQSGLKMIVNVQCFSSLALVTMFGYLFLSDLGPQLNISTLNTLVFLLLQKFVFTLHVRYCCVIRAYSSDFNPSSYLQLWIGSLHQSYTAGTSLGVKLIGLSSLGAGDFILRDIVHQLKHLQLSKFDDRNPTMARIIAIYQKHMTT